MSVQRRFAQVIGLIALLDFGSLALTRSAMAQSAVPTSFDPSTGLLTITDTPGNSYVVDFSMFSPTSRNDLPGFFFPYGRVPLPANFFTKPTSGVNFTINAISANQKLLACSATSTTTTITTTIIVFETIIILIGSEPTPVLVPVPVTVTSTVPDYPATCYVTDTPLSLLASLKQELRSQSNETTDMITDRLQVLGRELADGLAAPVETPPGGTVILNDFSANPRPKYDGIAAGSDTARWGVWANASGTSLRNDNAVFAFNGPSTVAMTGIDYIVDRHWIVGLSAGYSRADLALSPSVINRTASGAVVGPYTAYILSSNWSVDALVNWTSLANDITAPLPFPAGSFHANRVTGASHLNYFTTLDTIKLTGFAGYAYSWEGGRPSAILPSNLANNIRYGAIRVGGEAALPLGAFEPYVPLRFEYETTTPTDGTSRAALVAGAGLRYRWSDALSASLLFEATEFKTHTRDILVSGNLRWRF